MSSFFEGLEIISSGIPKTDDADAQASLFSYIFDFLADSASWAGAVAALIGLLN